VINIVTVHWMTPKWVDVQLDYLHRNMGAAHRVFASLNGIDDSALRGRFHFARDIEGKHAVKLNALADVVSEHSESSDILIFLDGDAFPIRPLVPWIEQTLRSFPLVAIRRDENLGDPQPHPSFCATTVGFWNDIGGDWRGGEWVNEAGMTVHDTGGKLLHNLRERSIDWLPLLRTNTIDLHPVWFGIYDHRVYHHGAGFQAARAERVVWSERFSKTGQARRSLRPTKLSPSLGTLRRTVAQDPSSIRQLTPTVVWRAGVKTWRVRREHRYYEQQRRSSQGQDLDRLNDRIFSRLQSDPTFYRDLDDWVLDDAGPSPDAEPLAGDRPAGAEDHR